MTKDKKSALCRALSADSMVLLKNEPSKGGKKALPLSKNEKIAAFGRTFYFCLKGGAGSGDVLGVTPVQPYDAMKARGVMFDEEVAAYYRDYNSARYDSELRYWNRYNREWKNCLPEAPIPEELIKSSAKHAKTAVLSIGRSSGEWIDFQNTPGSFQLTDTERELVDRVTDAFERVILVLNTCGVFDIDYLLEKPFSAILNAGMGGEQMGEALTDVLLGEVTPSGKLASTWAPLCDYPTNENFYDLTIPYHEGIYVGYRYFDSFNVTPWFPFGFGLSYTDFEITPKAVTLEGSAVTVTATVKNIGNCNGREVVQLYLSEPCGMLSKAYQQLAAFQKTAVLKPQTEETVTLSFDLCNFASYNEAGAEFILERGNYWLRLGNSSRNTHVIARLSLSDEISCMKTYNRLKPQQNLSVLSADESKFYTYPDEAAEKEAAPSYIIDEAAVRTVVVARAEDNLPKSLSVENKVADFNKVINKKASLEDFVAGLSLGELADILNGVTGKTENRELHVGTMAQSIKGAAGEIWSSEKYGIPRCVNADGPTGIRLGGFIDEGSTEPPSDTELSLKMTAYPTATTIASGFDTKLAEEFGRAVADDMRICNLSGWLAPSMNIHRSPLCGRNFEYYSEDPLISGKMAAATVRGVQQNPDGTPSGYYATIKHLCANNAETHRFDSDSVVSERALREIYLRGFEIAVKESKPIAVMNSYNKVNGSYSSDSFDLNTGILRFEWGFDGCVMTDWCAKSSAFLMTNAGCDLVMPGLKNAEYKSGLADGRISLAAAQQSVVRILMVVLKTAALKKAESKEN